MITPGLFFLICLVYARVRRGAQWDGMVLGAMFGVSLAGGSFVHGAIVQLNSLAYDLGVEILRVIGDKLGGGTGGGAGPTPANGIVAVRYNLGLIGIGR